MKENEVTQQVVEDERKETREKMDREEMKTRITTMKMTGESMLGFMHKRCLECDYKEQCEKKEENLEEIERIQQHIKSKNIHELSDILGVKI